MAEADRSTKTRIVRGADRANYEIDRIKSILDASFLCHVGFVANGEARVLPTAYVRIDDAIYLHGHLRNQMMNTLLDGQTACISVTILDGLVLARSGFHHSVNYRSVSVYGKAEKIEGVEKESVLDCLVNHLVPQRVPALRPHTPQELNATLVLKIPLDEAVAKIRQGPPVDAEKDYDSDIWAGVVDVHTVLGEITPCPRLDPSISTPAHVSALVAQGELFTE